MSCSPWRGTGSDVGRTLHLAPDRLAICRLDREAPEPYWLGATSFRSVTRTPEELSIVCDAAVVPPEVTAVRDWRALRVAGVLEFSETGVLSSLATPLAEAGISLFAVSTYDTDYVLVREGDLDRAVAALRCAGFVVEQGSDPVRGV